MLLSTAFLSSFSTLIPSQVRQYGMTRCACVRMRTCGSTPRGEHIDDRKKEKKMKVGKIERYIFLICKVSWKFFFYFWNKSFFFIKFHNTSKYFLSFFFFFFVKSWKKNKKLLSVNWKLQTTVLKRKNSVIPESDWQIIYLATFMLDYFKKFILNPALKKGKWKEMKNYVALIF